MKSWTVVLKLTQYSVCPTAACNAVISQSGPSTDCRHLCWWHALQLIWSEANIIISSFIHLHTSVCLSVCLWPCDCCHCICLMCVQHWPRNTIKYCRDTTYNTWRDTTPTYLISLFRSVGQWVNCVQRWPNTQQPTYSPVQSSWWHVHHTFSSCTLSINRCLLVVCDKFLLCTALMQQVLLAGQLCTYIHVTWCRLAAEHLEWFEIRRGYCNDGKVFLYHGVLDSNCSTSQ